jgi:hypothetical protein
MNGFYCAAAGALPLGTPALSTFAVDSSEEVKLAPAAIGADVPVTYFGPQPSSVQRLRGRVPDAQIRKIDVEKATITLPMSGR